MKPATADAERLAHAADIQGRDGGVLQMSAVMPWDGVPGPYRRQLVNRTMVAYQDALYVDYIDIPSICHTRL